jgi:Flp pilus assembly protein TadB
MASGAEGRDEGASPSATGQGNCKLAPGVVAMWLGDDDRYEPIYSKEEVNRRAALLLKELPEIGEKKRQAKAELDSLEKHRDELVRLRTEDLLTVEAWLPAVGFGALAGLLSWMLHRPLWLGLVVALVTFFVQRTRIARRRRETVARVNALRSRDGLPLEQWRWR